MSAEREQAYSTSPEIDSRRARRERHLGGQALIDGFIPLEETLSPHDAILQTMNDRIIDQPDALKAIIDSLDRSEVRLANDSRPIANFAFLGPTGVGKSETAKLLAELLGDGEDNLIKINCSEYAHGHEVTTLTGAPPSYVGRGQEPVFAKESVEQPGTVVLFDEVEKGSKELYNLMLQIMGDGELRLNNGDTAKFRDTIIILTSNLGAREMSSQLHGTPLGFGERERVTDKTGLDKLARKSFAEFFSPEFTNRLNNLVVFHPLSADGLGRILDVKLEDANREYEEVYGAHISLTEATRKHIIELAEAESHLGARPLVRALEENVQTEFGRYVGMNKVPKGTHVRIFHRDEVPEDYAMPDDKQLLFTLKRDSSLLKPLGPDRQLTAAPLPSQVFQCGADGIRLQPQSPFILPTKD